MTAEQEVKNWKEEFCQLNTYAEREAFKEKMFASIGNKMQVALAEGLLALMDAIRETRIQAEKIYRASYIKVFPASEKDKKMLEALLVRMDILHIKLALEVFL